ncbi:MAG: hypothetical protein NZM33_16820 [Bryobacteraceae bacterium]|nr:hypothetical protein [Bryobacteraceae bacterium]
MEQNPHQIEGVGGAQVIDSDDPLCPVINMQDGRQGLQAAG